MFACTNWTQAKHTQIHPIGPVIQPQHPRVRHLLTGCDRLHAIGFPSALHIALAFHSHLTVCFEFNIISDVLEKKTTDDILWHTHTLKGRHHQPPPWPCCTCTSTITEFSPPPRVKEPPPSLSPCLFAQSVQGLAKAIITSFCSFVKMNHGNAIQRSSSCISKPLHLVCDFSNSRGASWLCHTKPGAG